MLHVWSKLNRNASLAVAAMFVPTLYVVGTIAIAGFGGWASVNAILTLGALLGIASGGQTLVILLGGIDLSIPYVIDMADVVAAELHARGWPFVAIVCLVLGIALLVGFVNGFLASRLKVSPLIITFGIGLCVQGGVEVWTHGAPTGSAPAWLRTFVSPSAHTGFLPVAPIVLFWVGFAVALLVLLSWTTLGRQIFAVG